MLGEAKQKHGAQEGPHKRRSAGKGSNLCSETSREELPLGDRSTCFSWAHSSPNQGESAVLTGEPSGSHGLFIATEDVLSYFYLHREDHGDPGRREN